MFSIILSQVLRMGLILVVGYVIFRMKLITHEGNVCLSNLLLLVVNPLMIFQSFMVAYTPARMRAFGISALLAAMAHLIAVGLAVLVARKNGNGNHGIERICVIFSNCGFMGIPLISSILGSEGVLYLTPYIVVFTVFLWTYGLSQMIGKSSPQLILRGLTSPAMIAIVIGLIFFVTGLRLPDFMDGGFDTLASMNTPLSMLIAGISLAETDLAGALKKKRLYLICAFRLLVVPAAFLLLIRFLPVSRDIRIVNLIAAACPAATSGTLFALRYGGDYKYASEIFAVSTVLSMATIPLFVFLAERLL